MDMSERQWASEPIKVAEFQSILERLQELERRADNHTLHVNKLHNHIRNLRREIGTLSDEPEDPVA
jgi:tetrahydromethanopterin S-methyltransferase subunit G